MPETTQTSSMQKLARKLRSGKKRRKTWIALAIRYHIVDGRGNPSPAWALRIARGDQPGVEMCKRMGYGTTCPMCHQHVARHYRRKNAALNTSQG
jgi:hypothetical protein